MKNTYLLFGLRRLYAQTLGYIRAGQDRSEDLTHVAYVIGLVAPHEDLTAIRPVRPYRPHRHEWSRAALDILRTDGRPMAARELARRVIASEGGEASDLPSIPTVQQTGNRLYGTMPANPLRAYMLVCLNCGNVRFHAEQVVKDQGGLL